MKFRHILFILILSNTFSGIGAIDIYRFKDLEQKLHEQNDTTYIINFWATWCIPCRKELPAFEKIHKEFTGKAVKVILVSLDFPKDIETSLIPFLTKYNITANVLVLNDPDSNSWINKVDPEWSGAIPATLIYRNSHREFYEREFDYETLKEIILKTI